MSNKPSAFICLGCCSDGFSVSTPLLNFIDINTFMKLPAATKLGQSNIFTGICDSVHGGGSLPQCILGYTPPPRADPPSRHPPEQTPPQSRHPPEQTPPGSRHPPGAHPPREADSGIRSTSGRYASYWNAFFLLEFFWINFSYYISGTGTGRTSWWRRSVGSTGRTCGRRTSEPRTASGWAVNTS